MAPKSVNTSGIIQPPVHATAALKVWENRKGSEDAARAFLKGIFGPLKAWHAYLYRERQWQDGLVWLRHPWESGMDNSPLWDEAMHAIDLKPGMVSPYKRVDNTLVNAHDRPTQWTYDRFVWLVEQARRVGYNESEIVKIRVNNYLIVDVLFNSLLVTANRDLASIAKILGESPKEFEDWAALTSKGIQDHLWDASMKAYRNYDVVKGGLTSKDISLNLGAFSPIYASVPGVAQLEEMLSVLTSNHFATVDEIKSGKVWPFVTFDRQDPNFKSTNYWRGPVWINMNWIFYKGLKLYSNQSEAAKELAVVVKKATIDLSLQTGLWEYFDCFDSSGHGTDDFSWSAALLIDLVNEPQ
jgi:hypothetical protein